jgi:hypothetical protein
VLSYFVLRAASLGVLLASTSRAGRYRSQQHRRPSFQEIAEFLIVEKSSIQYGQIDFAGRSSLMQLLAIKAD